MLGMKPFIRYQLCLLWHITSLCTYFIRRTAKYNKQIFHATVLDIKVYYYPRNAIFHEAIGRVEYCHSEGSNKPDIQHSKSAIFALLYLHLHTKTECTYHLHTTTRR